MQVIQLEEEVEKELTRDEFDDASALALDKSGRFEVEFPSVKNGYRYVVRSKGWIGHIPVSPNVVVDVRPKMPVATIFGMLEVAYNLKSFELLEGQTHVNTIEEMFQRLAAILASRVIDRARKGLFQTYLSHREDLSFVRGRVDVRESLKRSMQGSPYLHCEFQQLTHDVEDNHLLLWTLYVVSRAGPGRPDVARLVRQAYRALSGHVSLTEKQSDDCINRFYHRLNEDYRPLHGLCRLLLDHLGPDMERGEHLFLPFMLNMPSLFELFVAEWLKRHAADQWIVTSQHTAKLKANADLTFRIDLFLKDKRSGVPIAILDTKYKATELPTESDIQQVIAYAVECGVDRAFLVYPSNRARPVKVEVGAIEVVSIAFDIAAKLEAEGQRFIEQLVSLLPNRAISLGGGSSSGMSPVNI